MVEPNDNIEVEMHIYERGIGVTSIITTNSRDRSLIGSYNNAVQKAKKTGNDDELKRFQNVQITDTDGISHEFETDLDTLYEIEESIEEPEYFDIYT